MTKTHKQVRTFMTTLQKEYPQLKIKHKHDEEEDFHYIIHNNSEFLFDNEGFPSFAGRLIKTLFYNKDIYNVSFGYDYYEQYFNNYQIKTDYNCATIQMFESILTTDLFYKQVDTPEKSLLINNLSNIKFTLDVTDSFLASYNRQAHTNNSFPYTTYQNAEGAVA